MVPEEGLRLLLRRVWGAFTDGRDIDGSDLQDWFNDSGLVECRDVNPDENEWDADSLYFLKPEVKAWLDKTGD